MTNLGKALEVLKKKEPEIKGFNGWLRDYSEAEQVKMVTKLIMGEHSFTDKLTKEQEKDLSMTDESEKSVEGDKSPKSGNTPR